MHDCSEHVVEFVRTDVDDGGSGVDSDSELLSSGSGCSGMVGDTNETGLTSVALGLWSKLMHLSSVFVNLRTGSVSSLVVDDFREIELTLGLVDFV